MAVLLGYNLFDEPIKFSSVYGRPIYNLVRELDPKSSGLRHYSSAFTGDESVDWTDCLGADIYWTPGNVGLRGTVNKVAKYTWLLNKRAAERGPGVVSVDYMAEYWSGIRKRAILRKEQFCQTYLAVIHGQGHHLFPLAVHRQGYRGPSRSGPGNARRSARL